jgi:hypothetical protein
MDGSRPPRYEPYPPMAEPEPGETPPRRARVARVARTAAVRERNAADQREALRLRESGLSWPQVAEQLGISVNLAKWRGYKALAARG